MAGRECADFVEGEGIENITEALLGWGVDASTYGRRGPRAKEVLVTEGNA